MLAPKRNNKRFYKGKEYSNPFFNRETHRPKIKFLSRKMIKILLIVSLLLVVWLIFFSDYFIIKNIEVSGEGSHTSEINDLAWAQTRLSRFLAGKQNNLVFFDKTELSNVFNEKYFFDELSIKKEFPDKVVISFREKSYSVVWQEGEHFYFINTNGDIIKEISTSTDDITIYPIIENKANSAITGKNIFGYGEQIQYASDLYPKINNINYFKFTKFVIDDEQNTLKVATDKENMIYFNIKDDQDLQLSRLSIALKEKIKDSFDSLKYVDLRYGDKIYYK